MLDKPASKLAACTFILIGLQARSQLPPSSAPLQYSAALYAQANARALAVDLRLTYRHDLGAAGSSIGGFASMAAGPVGFRPGVGIAVQPFVNRADYGSGAFSAPRDGPGGNYALWVQQLTLHATLQAVLGPIAIRNTTRGSRFFADLHGDDRVFYDPLLDVVVYKDGWAVQNDTDLAYLWTSNFLVGLRHTLIIAWYPSDAYAPGEPQENPNTPISKLGPVVAWRFLDGDSGLLQRGSLLLAAQWYLAHRYRTGATASGAFPSLGLALVFSGDLVRGP